MDHALFIFLCPRAFSLVSQFTLSRQKNEPKKPRRLVAQLAGCKSLIFLPRSPKKSKLTPRVLCRFARARTLKQLTFLNGKRERKISCAKSGRELTGNALRIGLSFVKAKLLPFRLPVILNPKETSLRERYPCFDSGSSGQFEQFPLTSHHSGLDPESMPFSC
jgi:hypothetical protein